MMNRPEARFEVMVPVDPENVHEDKYMQYFERMKYNEADALEDEILFPEEASGEQRDNLFRPDDSAMARFEEGKIGDVRRWACDLDSDEDTEHGYLDDEDEDAEMYDPEAADDDEWEDEEQGVYDEYVSKLTQGQSRELVPKSDAADQAWDEFTHKFSDYLNISDRRRQHYVFDQFNDPTKPLDLSCIPEDIRKSDEDVMVLMRLSLMKEKDYNDMREEIMRPEWERFLNRQKAKSESGLKTVIMPELNHFSVFKEAFHQSDPPEARRRWFMQNTMIRLMDDYQMTKLTLGPFEMIKAMGLIKKMQIIDKRIIDDAFLAYAAISLFYDGEAFMKSPQAAFFTIKTFQDFLQAHPLLDQQARARQFPNRRTSQCNKMAPPEMWAEWDRLCRENKRSMTDGEIDHFYPVEWDKVIRPKIARCKS